MTELISSDAQDILRCTYCSFEAATEFCRPCRYNLCSRCKPSHLEERSKFGHDIVLIGKKNEDQRKLTFCQYHPQQVYGVCCDDCSIPVCGICVLENHTNHKISTFSSKLDINKKINLFRCEIIKSNKETEKHLPMCCAQYDYHTTAYNEMSFKRGDLLQPVDDSNCDWWFVRRINSLRDTEQTEGYIPRNHVATYDTFVLEDWFVGVISEDESEKWLLSPQNGGGNYLVRENAERQGSYILSVRENRKFQGDVINHYEIRAKEEVGVFISEGCVLPTMEKLILHYTREAGDLCKRLKLPCSKFSPAIKTRIFPKKLSRESISVEEKIGSGTYGVVCKGRWSSKIVAIKEQKDDDGCDYDFLEEANVMAKCQHDRIVPLFGVCLDGFPKYIVTEFFPKGNLKSLLRNNERQHLAFSNMLSIGRQVASGMTHLERKNIIHRELAACNVFVGAKNLVKIGDFSQAKTLIDGVYNGYEAKTKIKWKAPEAILHGQFTSKSDVWSFGIFLIEMFTQGNDPYPDLTPEEAFQQVQKGRYHPQPTECSASIYNLMLRCWDRMPRSRPTFEFIFNFFNDYFTSSDHGDNNLTTKL